MAWVPGTSDLKSLLWHCFWAHWICKCCPGIESVHIGFGYVAVASVLGTLGLNIWLWPGISAYLVLTCFCGLCSGRIGFEKVAAAIASCMSSFKNATVAHVLSDSELLSTICAYYSFTTSGRSPGEGRERYRL